MSDMERPTQNSARLVRTYPVPPADLLDAARRAVRGLPRWSISSENEKEVNAVRATRLFRFKDDVTVRAEPHEDGARVELSSASRLGKGDLGQNPRNIKELLRAVDRELSPRA